MFPDRILNSEICPGACVCFIYYVCEHIYRCEGITYSILKK